MTADRAAPSIGEPYVIQRALDALLLARLALRKVHASDNTAHYLADAKLNVESAIGMFATEKQWPTKQWPPAFPSLEEVVESNLRRAKARKASDDD